MEAAAHRNASGLSQCEAGLTWNSLRSCLRGLLRIFLDFSIIARILTSNIMTFLIMNCLIVHFYISCFLVVYGISGFGIRGFKFEGMKVKG